MANKLPSTYQQENLIAFVNRNRGEQIMEPGIDYNKRIGIIGIELLTKAALCAATVGAIAGMAAALFFRS